MKSIWHSVLAGCMTIALGASSAMAEQPTTLPSSSWTPPVDDAPADPAGGPTRSSQADPELVVTLMSPSASVGLTANSQPTLYWYLTKPTKYRIEITLTPRGEGGRDIGAAPILDVVIPKTDVAGMQAISLADPPAKKGPVWLKPGVQYDWVVEIVVRKHGGSDDPVAATRLKCIKAPDVVIKKRSAPLGDQYEAARESALWYDMLEDLNRMIDSAKDKSGLLRIRGELLSGQSLLEGADGKITEIRKKE